MVTFLSRILVTFINVPISMLVARRLGVEGQGAYSAVVAMTSLWTTLSLLGVDAAHTYYLAGKRFSLAQVVSNSILWSVGLGLVATPLYLLLAPLVEGDRTQILDGVLTLSALAVPLGILKYFSLSIFLGEGRVERFNLLNVLSNLALLGLLVLLLWVAPGGIAEAVSAYVASLAVFAVGLLLWIGARVRKDGPFRWSPHRGLASGSLIYGLKGHLGNLVVQLTYRSDQILVTRILGLEAQGFYSIAVLLAEKLSQISASIQLVLFPRISAVSREEANRITPAAVRFTLLVVLVAAVALALLGRGIVQLLYGDAFMPALPAFFVLLPGIVVLSVSKLLAVDLSGRNRRWGPTVAVIIAFALNLVLNVLWIPRHGIVGAAWASNLAYALQSAILVGIFARVTGVSALQLFRPTREDGRIFLRLLRQLTRRTRSTEDPPL